MGSVHYEACGGEPQTIVKNGQLSRNLTQRRRDRGGAEHSATLPGQLSGKSNRFVRTGCHPPSYLWGPDEAKAQRGMGRRNHIRAGQAQCFTIHARLIVLTPDAAKSFSYLQSLGAAAATHRRAKIFDLLNYALRAGLGCKGASRGVDSILLPVAILRKVRLLAGLRHRVTSGPPVRGRRVAECLPIPLLRAVGGEFSQSHGSSRIDAVGD